MGNVLQAFELTHSSPLTESTVYCIYFFFWGGEDSVLLQVLASPSECQNVARGCKVCDVKWPAWWWIPSRLGIAVGHKVCLRLPRYVMKLANWMKRNRLEYWLCFLVCLLHKIHSFWGGWQRHQVPYPLRRFCMSIMPSPRSHVLMSSATSLCGNCIELPYACHVGVWPVERHWKRAAHENHVFMQCLTNEKRPDMTWLYYIENPCKYSINEQPLFHVEATVEALYWPKHLQGRVVTGRATVVWTCYA